MSLAILGCLVFLGLSELWPKYLLAQAENALAADNLNQAEAVLRRLVAHFPENARARFPLAQVLRRQGRPDQAEESLRIALELGYDRNDGERELALDEAAIKFRPPLEYTLRKLSEENPDDLDVVVSLARGYFSIREWRQAESYFSRLIEQQPENVDWYWERGQARRNAASESETGEGQEFAAADFREVLRRNPDHLEARLRLAQYLLGNAHMKEAREEFLKCNHLDPERPEPLIGLANCALEEQDWNRANNLLTQALERQWNSLIALALKGDLHLLRQQNSEAIQCFQKILVLEPTNKAAHLKLAQAFRSSGKLSEARNQESAYERLRLQEEKETKERRPP
jgi:tetratricopeptide (TPR) repeat protein